MTIAADDRAWLSDHSLLDPEIADDLDAVRLHSSGPPSWYLSLVRRNAITLGDHVWFRVAERRRDRPLLAHELVHVAQYRRIGRLRFLGRYLLDLVKHRGYSRSLPLEAPAYERAEQARALPGAELPGAEGDG